MIWRTLRGLPIIAAILLVAATSRAADVTFWIEPCSVMTGSNCSAGDLDLARWAFQAWEAASGGRLHFVELKERGHALIRVLWADKDSGLYGEAVPILVNGRRGRELHILIEDSPGPDSAGADSPKRDKLMRDTVVYLTCLHESGHALGLEHTNAFADIMYSFQYGGDIPEYFGRYRRKLNTREDIRKNSGMSPADRDALIESIAKGVPR